MEGKLFCVYFGVFLGLVSYGAISGNSWLFPWLRRWQGVESRQGGQTTRGGNMNMESITRFHKQNPFALRLLGVLLFFLGVVYTGGVFLLLSTLWYALQYCLEVRNIAAWGLLFTISFWHMDTRRQERQEDRDNRLAAERIRSELRIRAYKILGRAELACKECSLLQEKEEVLVSDETQRMGKLLLDKCDSLRKSILYIIETYEGVKDPDPILLERNRGGTENLVSQLRIGLETLEAEIRKVSVSLDSPDPSS